MDLTFNLAEESKKLTNLEVNEICSSCDIGNFEEIHNYVMENKDINLKIPGKLFLNKFLNLTGAEISFGVCQREWTMFQIICIKKMKKFILLYQVMAV